MKPGTVVTHRQVASKIYEPDSPENIRLRELALREALAELADLEAHHEDYTSRAADGIRHNVNTLLQQKAMGPDYSRKGIFINHNCSYCRNGELTCKQGAPNRCDNPRARND